MEQEEDEPGPAPAKPEPLFILDLGANGGIVAPTTTEELMDWIRHEQESWSWLFGQGLGNAESVVRRSVQSFGDALNLVEQYRQALRRGSDNASNFLTECQYIIRQIFVERRVPHSSSPTAARIRALNAESGRIAGAHYLWFMLEMEPERQISGITPLAWQGLLEGAMDRYQLPGKAQKGRRAAAELSFEQLRTKADQLVAKLDQNLSALHREYEGLAAGIRSESERQAKDFEEAQTKKAGDFEELTAGHAEQFAKIRATYLEDMKLRAPAAYWTEKFVGHRKWAIRWGGVSLAGIVAAAVGLGWQTHDLLSGLKPGTPPESWKIGALALVGLFTVWALRLVVRLFLSNLHLATDAAERKVMVQMYLALVEGEHAVAKEDRQLILQALFRPASDGIVKDEAIPFSVAELFSRSPTR